MYKTSLLFLAGLAFVACSVEQNDDHIDPINVVVVVADDLGWNDLSCYGNTFIETPNLDRLASIGVRFSDAYAAASLCSPSRASLMTGLHPVEVNITEHIHGNQPPRPNQQLATPFIDQSLSGEYMTLGEMFQEEGYATGYFGKWHLGGGESSPDYRGFDVNIGGSFYGLPGTFFYPFFGEGRMPRLQDRSGEGDYLTDVLAESAVDFIRDNRDSSFFCYLAFYSPHVPIEGKAELVAKYHEKRRAFPNDSLPRPEYAAMVESIDQNVGKLLKVLEETGTAERTVVIFTSDNGGLHVREVPAFAKHTPPMRNDPLRAGKGYLYEGGIRAPLLIRWPGIEPSSGIDSTPVTGQDLFHTFAEVLEHPAPDNNGISLLPVLRGRPAPKRDLVWHVPHYTPQGGKPASALREGRYKVIEFYEDERVELYDLKTDIGETFNLAGSRPELTERLSTKLREWKLSSGAKLPTPNPDYQPAEN